MTIDFNEYENEMKIVRQVMTDEQTEALCGVLVKVVFSNLFNADLINDKNDSVEFTGQDERSVA